jgi:hypothetical protein
MASWEIWLIGRKFQLIATFPVLFPKRHALKTPCFQNLGIARRNHLAYGTRKSTTLANLVV